MQTYDYTCKNCGKEKQIYVYEGENPEELSGCVCDREVKNNVPVGSNFMDIKSMLVSNDHKSH